MTRKLRISKKNKKTRKLQGGGNPIQAYNTQLQLCTEATDIFCRYFSNTYEDARTKFRHHCKIHNLSTNIIKIPCNYDNDLTIDIGIIWGNKSNIFLHISGTHGVEAYAGSAIQIYLLERMATQGIFTGTYTGPTIIFVHCLNPYGMKYGRRFNEANIDLNRNYCTLEEFKTLTSAPPSNIYLDMNDWLNPAENRDVCNLTTTEKLQMAYYVTRYGKTDIKQNVVGGQYKFPKGIFFGGTSVAQSHQRLTTYLKSILPKNSAKLAILDVHTGIGPMGIDTLLCNTMDEFKQLSNITNNYDHIQVRDPAKSISYKIHGNTINAYNRELKTPTMQTLIAVQEFGTYPATDVLIKIRSEASIYYWTKNKTKNNQQLSNALLNRKCKLRDIFTIDTLEWQNSVITRGVIVFNQFNKWLGANYNV